MAKKLAPKNKNTAGRKPPVQPRRTGLDRFASAPAADSPADGQGRGAQTPRPSGRGGTPAAQQRPSAKTGQARAGQDNRGAASGSTQGNGAPRKAQRGGKQKPAPRSGMQVKVGAGTQTMQPQKKAVTARPAGGAAAQARKGTRSQRLRRIVRRKARRAKLTKLAAVFLSVVCSLFALTAFFQIGAIEFRGLTRYEAADVLATFGVKTGENMFFCDSWRGARRVKAAYPYFSDVQITRDLPSKLIINVTESKPAAVVNGTRGGWYILGQDCRVLEKTDEQGAKDVAEIMGLETEGSEPGTELTAAAPDKISDLKALMSGLDEMEMLESVRFYNIQSRTRIWFQYEDRFAVCIGDAQNLTQKLGLLRQLIHESQFSPSDKGTIDLSQGSKAFADMSLTANQVEQAVQGRLAIQHIDDGDGDASGEDGADPNAGEDGGDDEG